MSQFSNLFRNYSAPSLLLTHGEVAYYIPLGVEDNAREIKAIVDRREWAMGETGELAVIAYAVRAANLSTGILTSEVDAGGGDLIRLKLRDGDASWTDLRIVGQPTLNAGMTRVRVR